MAIDSYEPYITSREVDDRIEELEEYSGQFEVYRLRNDEVIETFDDEDDAIEYRDKEDYDPARVRIRQQEMDEDEKNELDSLRELKQDADSTFGEPWTIRKSSYFDEGWAKQQAQDQGLNIFSWPLEYVDWEEAADALLQDKSYVDFDGEQWYED